MTNVPFVPKQNLFGIKILGESCFGNSARTCRVVDWWRRLVRRCGNAAHNVVTRIYRAVDLLNRNQNAQECDATEVEQNYLAGFIKKLNLIAYKDLL